LLDLTEYDILIKILGYSQRTLLRISNYKAYKIFIFLTLK